MYRFWENVIKPMFELCGIKSIVEIGAQNGYNTTRLIQYAIKKSGVVHSIDPFPSFEYKDWEKEYMPHFFMHIGLSLDVLDKIEECDAYLVDGDHNWYTVYHELNRIKDIVGKKECLVILHDIGWPYDRRDLYYNPDNIPSEFQNAYLRKGIIYGQAELDEEGINGHLCNAIEVNTARNGVLTAIEDFLNENTEFEFMSIKCCSGLGIIKKKGTFAQVFDFLQDIVTLQNVIEIAEEDRLQIFQQRYTYKNKYDRALADYNKEKLRNEELKISEIKAKENSERLVEERKLLKKEVDLSQKEIELLNREIDSLKNEFMLLKAENVQQKENISKRSEEIKEYKKIILDSKKNIEDLREEGRKTRKENRKMRKELETVLTSKRYRYACYLSEVLHKPYKIFSLPYKICKKVMKRNSGELPVEEVKPVSLEIAEKSADVRMIEKTHIKFPEVLVSDNYEIFNSKCLVNRVSIVVCVHNALSDVGECLCSLWENRTFPYEIILIDDGSEGETRDYLTEFAARTKCKLHRNEEAIGYTKSANIGLKLSQADFVVLLNSDTIVTSGWIEKMLMCFEKNPDTGIVSPFSNAATYQSIPETRDAVSGDWKINVLGDGITVEMMALIVEKASIRKYPKVAALNGFCFMIKRAVLDKIGYLDEENFPKGYGEEVDYCIRAVKAGFYLRVADDTYIFHEKSKSFTHAKRKELGAASKPILKEKHGDTYRTIGTDMENNEELKDAREAVISRIDSFVEKFSSLHNKRIAFFLTAKGGSGGANSVCQEVMGMRRLGIEAFVLNSSNYKTEFEKNYPEMVPYVLYYDKKSEQSLLAVGKNFDIIIGTIFTTIEKLKIIKQAYPFIKTGYYVQDYEPYFFEETEDYWRQAKESYTLIEGNCLFAKTEWIARTVNEHHGIKVNIVEPSIDTRIYNPFVIREKEINKIINICAMVRPKTKRRNPKGTMEVLRMLKNAYQDKISVTIFGCSDDEVRNMGEDFIFDCTNLGVLKRWEVAGLLAQSDLFLDMSDYQAFGRTGLESMCLGCIPILPKEGGTDKFAVNGENAIVVNTGDVRQTYYEICKLLDKPDLMYKMQRAGMITGQGYNIMNAAWSEIMLLGTL